MAELAADAELYQIADELRAAALLGLRFDRDPYSLARCRKVLACSARIVAAIEGRDAGPVQAAFEDHLLHVCPLVGAEAMVVRDGRILLIRREDTRLWAIPGGLVEVGETLAEAAERELREEAGIAGRAAELLGIFDGRRWGSRTKVHLYVAVLRIEAGDQEPVSGPETCGAGFFPFDALPELHPGHDRRVPLLIEQVLGGRPVPFFDGGPEGGNR